MTLRPISMCTVCAYYDVNAEGVPTCEAFPAGIPQEIIHGDFDHRQEHPGQEADVLFEADTSKASKAAIEGILSRYGTTDTTSDPVQ